MLVSRVKTILALPIDKSVFYFTCWSVKKHAATVFKFDADSGKSSRLTHVNLNFMDVYTVQVKDGLFGFKQNATPAQFFHYAAIEDASQPVMPVEKARPSIPRRFPSLVNFCDKILFVSGGWNPSDIKHFHNSVERYDIARDVWSAAPALNVPRMNHSSCVLGYNAIYAFFGRNKTRYE